MIARIDSGECVFHSFCGGVSHARHHVRVCVQSYGYGGVAEEFLDELRVGYFQDFAKKSKKIVHMDHAWGDVWCQA